MEKGGKCFQCELTDNGSWSKAEIRKNEGGRYLLVSVLSMDTRRYLVIFPESFDLLGWAVVAMKIKDLGTVGSNG